MSPWQVQAAERAALILRKIPPEWMLSAADLAYARSHRNVTGTVITHFLDGFEKELLALDSVSILRQLWNGECTAVECVKGFCKIACIAHQIVSFPSSIYFFLFSFPEIHEKIKN